MSPILLKRLCPLSTSEDRGLSVSQIAKSGVLVFRQHGRKLEFLLLYRQKQNDWSFPKGHVEAGEGLLEAGLREIFEEAAVSPMILGRLTDLEYLDGKNQGVRLALFLGYAEGTEYTQGVRHSGETAEWVPLDRVERTLSYENLRTYFRTCIKPLFSKKQTGARICTDVIFSELEPYKKGVRALTTTLRSNGITTRAVELNRYHLQKKNGTVTRICYCLTNHPHVSNIAFWCTEFDRYVLNGEYLRSWHSKSQVQRLLSAYDIPVLPSGPYLLSKMQHHTKWMLKSERHGERNPRSSEIPKQYPWNTYFEQMADERTFTEIKLGYVAGQILTDSYGLYPSSDMQRAMQRIQEYLGLEIFSVDLFVNPNGAFYVVDVNPAPAFFYNKEARKALAGYIQLIGKFF